MSTANTTYDDAKFTERLRSGDETVLSDVLALLGPDVGARLFWRFRGQLVAHDIEDALSVALYRLWASRESFDPARLPLSDWFFLKALNAARRIQRLLAAVHSQTNAVARLASVAEPSRGYAHERKSTAGDEPRRSPERQQVLREVRTAVSGLSPVDRAIFLGYVSAADTLDWTRPLVAELSLSAGAIRARKQRIFAKLRNTLQNLNSHRNSK